MQQKNSVVLVIILLGVVGYFVYTNRIKTESTTKTISSTQPVQDKVINWKIYTDTNYGFSFEYPSDWIQNNNLCNRKPFCLQLRGVDTIPSQEDYKYSGSGRLTKEAYFEDKNNIDKGLLPMVSPLNAKIIQINGQNAMQSLGYTETDYNITYPSYVIYTEILSDTVEVILSAVLPIETENRNPEGYDSLDANINKSEKLAKEILVEKKYENKGVEKVVIQYQKILSTFKFE